MSFLNKVVLVTGASSGIGAATAIAFAAEGAKVAIIGRNKIKLANTAEKCIKTSPSNKKYSFCKQRSKPLVIVADMMKDEDVKRILRETIKHFGKLDVLVNNAGIAINASILDSNAMEVFDRIMSTNLRSVVLLTSLAAPHLITSKGNIINVSSIAALSIITNKSSAYHTSKAGLDHFTRSIALELASKGVRVNIVNPGPVKTDIMESAGITAEQRDMLLASVVGTIPLGRVGEPEEVADVILFLASDKARSITGSTYVTDNGTLMNGIMNIRGTD